MAKYYGKIGYCYGAKEVNPGIWQNETVEREIYGDFIKNIKRTENSGNVNDNVNVNNQISFLADLYAMENFQFIKYATYYGCKWAITSVEVDYPRLILNLGGVYNEQ